MSYTSPESVVGKNLTAEKIRRLCQDEGKCLTQLAGCATGVISDFVPPNILHQAPLDKLSKTAAYPGAPPQQMWPLIKKKDQKDGQQRIRTKDLKGKRDNRGISAL